MIRFQIHQNCPPKPEAILNWTHTSHHTSGDLCVQSVFGSEGEEGIVLQFTAEGRGPPTKEPEE